MPVVDQNARRDPETGEWLIPPPTGPAHVASGPALYGRRTVFTTYDVTVYDESGPFEEPTGPTEEPESDDTPPDAA